MVFSDVRLLSFFMFMSVKHLVVGCANSVLAIAWIAFVMFASEEVVYVEEICNNYLNLLQFLLQPPLDLKYSKVQHMFREPRFNC